MDSARAIGRNAGSLKYDLLAALGAFGCAAEGHEARLTLRLITLIVARYNWQSDELSVGQREIATLWSVNERTVKRDLARLRGLGWLALKRPAARGRVAVHGLGVAAILASTRSLWGDIGADFVARLGQPAEAVGSPSDGAAVSGSGTNVISFPALPRPEAEGLWARAQARLVEEQPALHAAWFAALVALPVEDGVLRLTAPSRFHANFVAMHHLDRIETLVRALDASVMQVIVGA